MKNYSISKPIKLGIAYAVTVILLSSIITIFMHDSGSKDLVVTNGLKVTYILLFFLPLALFNGSKEFTLTELGFKFNWRSVIISLCIVLILSIATLQNSVMAFKLGFSIVEGIARTGEEFFFRGFIYLISLQIFKEKKNRNIIAMVLSSLIFTFAHTEIFLGTYQFGFLNMFFNTFITFAVLRHYSKSLLPVVTIHTYMNGGLISSIVGMLIVLCTMYINNLSEKRSSEYQESIGLSD
jgi:membrane protease YdiL (CAAX protease family)